MAVKNETTAPVENHQTESVNIGNGGDQPANVPAATEFDPSGAPIQIVSDVNPSHPAVDDNPRKGTTVEQNRIDFNDPTISGQEAVEKALGYKAADATSDDKSGDKSGDK